RFLRDKRALGDASRLEVNLVELDYVERARERETAIGERDRARQDFNRLLGLPPLTEVTLEPPVAGGLTYRSLTLMPATMEAVMMERRPDLQAARQEYEQAQQQLRLAYIRRIPWFRFGPAYERDGAAGEGSVNKLGVGIGIDLPIANLNQGEIAKLEA